jgi:hypothetical protein
VSQGGYGLIFSTARSEEPRKTDGHRGIQTGQKDSPEKSMLAITRKSAHAQMRWRAEAARVIGAGKIAVSLKEPR